MHQSQSVPKIYPKPPPPLIDLRKVVVKQTDNFTCNSNQLIIDQLEKLIEHTKKQLATTKGKERTRHQYRLRSFVNALKAIKNYPHPITSGKQLLSIKGIGKGVASRIDQIIQEHALSEISEETSILQQHYSTIEQLTQITGIGPSLAQKLVKDGITSIEDLRQKVRQGVIELPHHALVGLRWYEDFQKKIPREEIARLEQILRYLATSVEQQIKLCICGSYRRGLSQSGDIDVLITHPTIKTSEQLIASPRNYLKEMVELVTREGFIIDHLTTQGKTKYMGVIRLKSECPARRIDIRFVPYRSWATAVLYFTGSKNFNTAMRTHAIKMGYKLNEYGLFKLPKLIRIFTLTERDIFRILRLKYLSPNQRNL